MNNSKFSLVLRQCRENSGLTQKQVADALNIERSTYAYYETGTTHPSGATIIKLANVFNVSYTVLMEAVGDVEFDSSDEDLDFTTLSDNSWKERERIYTLTSDEQEILMSYRALTYRQKEDLRGSAAELKAENERGIADGLNDEQ